MYVFLVGDDESRKICLYQGFLNLAITMVSSSTKVPRVRNGGMLSNWITGLILLGAPELNQLKIWT